jgi:hypothetical protein
MMRHLGSEPHQFMWDIMQPAQQSLLVARHQTAGGFDHQLEMLNPGT